MLNLLHRWPSTEKRKQAGPARQGPDEKRGPVNFTSVRRVIQTRRPYPPSFAAQQALGMDGIPLGIECTGQQGPRAFAGASRNGRLELTGIEGGNRRDAFEQFRGNARIKPD